MTEQLRHVHQTTDPALLDDDAWKDVSKPDVVIYQPEGGHPHVHEWGEVTRLADADRRELCTAPECCPMRAVARG